MQTVTLNVPQLNALFGLAMPAIVAFVAGIIRQDRFPDWANELITWAVLIILAAVQTLFSGQGLDSILHFLIIAAWAFVALQTKFGDALQGKVQTVTSFGKLPPAPVVDAGPPALPVVNINPEQVAALILQNLNVPALASLLKQELIAANVPVPDQPTQANIPAIPKAGG